MASPPTAVPWVPPVLYTAVLAGGGYHAAVSDRPVHWAQTAGFAAGLVLLLLLEPVERRRFTRGTPAGPAAALLAVRVVLFSVVAVLDGSGVSRALFVLVPFTAHLAFGRRAGLLTGAGCVALLVTGYTVWVPRWWVQAAYVSDLLMFALALALALSMAAVAVREQQGRARLEGILAELEQSHEQLSDYALRVAELSTAGERNRVAREIHDSLGHHLTAIAIQLEKAEAFRERDPLASAKAVSDARWSAGRALTEVRESVSALRDARPFSLTRALADLARHLEDDRLTVTLDISGDETGYDAASLTALYRAAQEALTNAHRHGRATRIEVAAAYGPSAARLVVTDNGQGFGAAPAARPSGTGFGIRGMRERVELLGGRVDIEDRPASRPATGAVVTVTVPRSPLLAGSSG
ncbi:sensor histidine kinase [Kitasatospora sp. NPDC058170]|uniref:sensor histidine kinase n=1 Tax=Kitasatospora sp. NPDC058170 TaxID=3346364 RepID=UPI0036D92B5B